MTKYWIYAEGTDEAGCVVDGAGPEAAYHEAVRLGRLDPRGAQVWAVKFGEFHSLGRHEFVEANSKDGHCEHCERYVDGKGHALWIAPEPDGRYLCGTCMSDQYGSPVSLDRG